MKNHGYYDLLLKPRDNINYNYQISPLNKEKHNIKDIDSYLLKQLSSLVLEQLKVITQTSDKIIFLNKMISTFTTHQFSNNVLLYVNNKNTQDFVNHDIHLSDNHLFTNDNQQALINQLNQEIKTCDEVYFIYPFIANSLINKLRNAFTYANNHNIPINFITTTFDDMALFVNLYGIVKLIKQYPNIKIRVENNLEKRSERIHIKAAIFSRKSGFSSAIIGSSNLTTKGMILGKERNIKINEFENQNLYQSVLQQYHKLWNDKLVDFNDEQQRIELLAKIEYNRNQETKTDNEFLSTNYFLYDFQIQLINKLIVRRKLNKNKHLIVMATGFGKTVVATFNYLTEIKEHNDHKPSLLFIGHQTEIIDQALLTFRKVLNDKNFG